MPDDGKQPTSILSDTFCKTLAFPFLFLQGNFGFNIDRDVNLRSTGYFYQRLRNYMQMFVSDTDHIFYALSVKLNSQINVVLDKSL